MSLVDSTRAGMEVGLEPRELLVFDEEEGGKGGEAPGKASLAPGLLVSTAFTCKGRSGWAMGDESGRKWFSGKGKDFTHWTN